MNFAFVTCVGALNSGYGRPEARFFPKERQNFFHHCVGGDAVFFSEEWNGAMLNEMIGPTYAHFRRVNHLRVQMFHDRAAKTVVQNVILDRANDFDAAREEFESAGIDRLDPAWID